MVESSAIKECQLCTGVPSSSVRPSTFFIAASDRFAGATGSRAALAAYLAALAVGLTKQHGRWRFAVGDDVNVHAYFYSIFNCQIQIFACLHIGTGKTTYCVDLIQLFGKTGGGNRRNFSLKCSIPKNRLSTMAARSRNAITASIWFTTARGRYVTATALATTPARLKTSRKFQTVQSHLTPQPGCTQQSGKCLCRELGGVKRNKLVKQNLAHLKLRFCTHRLYVKG